MEQPKDYEVAAAIEAMDRDLREAYNEASLLVKVLYHLQDYILPVIFICICGGYLAGATFGKLW